MTTSLTVLSTAVDPASDQFQANDQEQRALAQDLRDRLAETALGGPESSRDRHVQRGKLLPRERVRRVLDEGSPFLEIGALAAHGMYEGAAPAAGMIAGIGVVRGRLVMVVCNDATVKGGTYYPMTCLLYTSPSPRD